MATVQTKISCRANSCRTRGIGHGGGGIFSFIHLAAAAAAAIVLALEHEGPAVYNIVDDEPAPVREWLPVLANARRQAVTPRPVWLARMIAGEGAMMLGTQARDASTAKAKAKEEVGWTRCATQLAPRLHSRLPPAQTAHRLTPQPPTGCRHPRRVRARRAALLGSRRLDCFRKSER